MCCAVDPLWFGLCNGMASLHCEAHEVGHVVVLVGSCIVLPIDYLHVDCSLCLSLSESSNVMVGSRTYNQIAMLICDNRLTFRHTHKSNL